jgi:hypothetical protein
MSWLLLTLVWQISRPCAQSAFCAGAILPRRPPSILPPCPATADHAHEDLYQGRGASSATSRDSASRWNWFGNTDYTDIVHPTNVMIAIFPMLSVNDGNAAFINTATSASVDNRDSGFNMGCSPARSKSSLCRTQYISKPSTS